MASTRPRCTRVGMLPRKASSSVSKPSKPLRGCWLFPGTRSLARSDSSISTADSILPASKDARASSSCTPHARAQTMSWRTRGWAARRVRATGLAWEGFLRTRCRSAAPFFLDAPPPMAPAARFLALSRHWPTHLSPLTICAPPHTVSTL